MGKHSKFKWKIGWTRKVHPRVAKAWLLQDSYTIYTYTSHISFPPKRKSKKKLSHPILQNCPARTSMKEKFITPVLGLQKSPNLDQSFLISWARYVQNFMAIRLV